MQPSNGSELRSDSNHLFTQISLSRFVESSYNHSVKHPCKLLLFGNALISSYSFDSRYTASFTVKH